MFAIHRPQIFLSQTDENASCLLSLCRCRPRRRLESGTQIHQRERTRVKAGRRFLEDSLTTFSVKNTRFGPWTHTHNTQTQQSTKRLNMAGHPVWTKTITMCAHVWTDDVSKKRRNDTCFHLACHTPKTVLVHLMIRQRAGVCPSFQHKKTKKKKKKEWGCSH